MNDVTLTGLQYLFLLGSFFGLGLLAGQLLQAVATDIDHNHNHNHGK